jgi:uncharacterized UBP type Zn finger protein
MRESVARARHAWHAINRFDRNQLASQPSIVPGPPSSTTCPHYAHIRVVQPSSAGCTDCLRLGESWEQLRMCMECGHVGCGDTSKHQHAIRHFRATLHPIARSIEPGEEWAWCYIDQLWFEKLTST